MHVTHLAPQLLHSAIDAVSRFDLRLALLALAFHLANIACHSIAIRNTVVEAHPGSRLSVLRAGAASTSGSALNTLLPARGGEAAKVGLLRLQLPGSSLLTLAGATSVVLLLDCLIGIGALVVTLALFGLPVPPGTGHVANLVLGHPVLLGATCLAAAAGSWCCRGPVLRIFGKLARGATVLRSPRRYVTHVAAFQVVGWLCRVAMATTLLGAFGLPASPRAAVLVIVLGSLSTLAATPGGAGAQQVLVVYGLQGTASASSALAFSVGMQLLVSVVNCAIGLAALAWLTGSIAPWRAVRRGMHAARTCAAAHELPVHGPHLELPVPAPIALPDAA